MAIKKSFSLIFIILCFSLTSSLEAQIARKVSVEAATNPKPDSYDYLLPLPCGLVMSFRVVFIPEKGYLGEVATYFGSDTAGSAGSSQNFINRKHKGYLGSSLSIENLPPDFQVKAWELKKQLSDDGEGRQLYLMGKYEVTNLQYQAVMYGDCELTPESARPVTNVSWHEAMDFTAKLMEYALANFPDSLPRNQEDARNVGLIRLPTEEEWEFASRGGHYVSQDNLAGEEFFPMEYDKKLGDYGLYDDEISPAVSAPAWIGTYLPNPAGLYDTIGNASEFIFEAFQMTLGSRLHGSAGGPIHKGGSFRSLKKDVTPGARQEFAYFFDTGLARSGDLGFRVAISAVNMGSFQRLEQISSEYGEATQTDNTLVENDPLRLVNQLLMDAENPNDQRAYETLRASILDYNFTVNEQRRLSTRSYIWRLVYGVLSIRTNGVRIQMLQNYITAIEDAISKTKQAIKASDTQPDVRKNLQSKLPVLEETLRTYKKTLTDYNTSYDVQRGLYDNLLLEAKGYPSDLLFEQLSMVKQDIKGDDRFILDLSHCFTTVSKNLDLVVNKQEKPTQIKRAELENYPSS
ncbi:MAG: formylglycine-generating enzyme family protein [Deltaproteobacteria bacterium]|jgi:hypothetical protein|nr:formylglycine-generating enzyme family protein [Deltaproteobacteria bacterium]